jgi:hypothetical protein
MPSQRNVVSPFFSSAPREKKGFMFFEEKNPSPGKEKKFYYSSPVFLFSCWSFFLTIQVPLISRMNDAFGGFFEWV